MENLNAEEIKYCLELILKNGIGMSRDDVDVTDIKRALALITSQEQRIKELNDKNEGLKAENTLLLNMQFVDNHGVETLRVKLNLPDPLNSGEEYVINHQKTIKQLIQKNKELTEENERWRKNLETFKGKQKSLQKQIVVLSKENHLLLSKDFDITVGICCIVFKNGKKGNIYTFTEKDHVAKEIMEGANENV